MSLALSLCLFGGLFAGLTGCKSSQKKPEPTQPSAPATPQLSRLFGKKVALVHVEGEATSRTIIEAALVNQLTQRGTFMLVPKEEIEAAASQPYQDPLDLRGLARRVGADWALQARVLEMDAVTREGYSGEDVEDSLWEKERGEKKRTLLYKVKSIHGKVRVQLDFADLQSGEERSAVAEHEDIVSSDKKTGAYLQPPRLPPRMTFLEGITNEAFRKFFDHYQ